MALDPVTAIANGVGQALSLVDQFVEDKDKANELKAGLIRMERETSLAIIKTSTTPFVDGLVKLMYALSDVGLKLFRPTISFLALCFVAYAKWQGIEIDSWLQGILAIMFPGWMVSRHAEKSDKARTEAILSASKENAKGGNQADRPNPFLDTILG